MNQNLMDEILGVYLKHGWQTRRLLLTPSMRAELDLSKLDGAVSITESDFDAVWFSRPSHQQREAWELRLLSEQAYALFETFEADEIEEDREERRQELEATMREKISGQ